LPSARFQLAGKDSEALTHWKNTATEFAQAMLLADKETTRGAENRKALMKGYGDNALKALRQAADLGFKDANYLTTAPEYRLLREWLREWPEFQRLVSEMEKKKSQ
jgi:hypothetical protein